LRERVDWPGGLWCSFIPSYKCSGLSGGGLESRCPEQSLMQASCIHKRAAKEGKGRKGGVGWIAAMG
jgi:hypothetical protein